MAAAEPGTWAPSARAELLFVGALVVVVLALLVQAVTLPFLDEDGAVGSGMLPLSFGGAVLVLLFARVAVLARGVRAGGPAVVVPRQLRLLGIAVVAVALCAVAGALVAVGVLLVAGLLLVDRVPLRATVLFTAVTLALSYLIFDVWLGLDLGLDGLL